MTGVIFDVASGDVSTDDTVYPLVPHVPTRKEQEVNRAAAFQSEADPLFFKWQAGEGTKEEWEAKREEIRARYPYLEE